MVSQSDTTMFLRQKKSGSRVYLQIVENSWENGTTKQRVIATVGRLDELLQSGGLDQLVTSAGRWCESLLVVSAHERGEALQVCCHRSGAVRVFERLWRETGCCQVVESLLAKRSFGFPVERAVFLTVLHRLVAPGGLIVFYKAAAMSDDERVSGDRRAAKSRAMPAAD